MKLFFDTNLKTRAVVATAGIILLVLGLNGIINSYAASSRYKEALMDKATALAEGVIKDINRALGFGLPLDALEGMGEKLRTLKEEDKDLSRAMVMDTTGKVLYSSSAAEENMVIGDQASRRALAADGPLIHAYSDAAGKHIEKVMPLASLDGKKLGVFRIALKSEAVNRQVWSLILWSLVVGVISSLAAVVLVYLFVGKVITGPIQSMAETAARIAAGDLSAAVAVSGKTEIATLGRAINILSGNLREILGRIRQTGAGLNEALQLMNSAAVKMSQGARVQQEATEQTAMTVTEMTASIRGVSENSEAMSRAAGEASSSAMEMATSVDEVAGSMETLSRSVEEAASSVEEMLASIRQVTENTESLAVSAEQATASITEMSASVKEVEQRAVESARLAEKVAAEASERGMAAAAEAIKGMDNIRKTVEASADVVNRLGKRSQEIGQILKVIDEVTDQTGLLALNAAILAAQAGEHGKGFAVVAEEIKELAERTAASTQEIAGLIAAVREETAQSVQAMARGLKAVETGSSLVTVTSDVLEQVAGTAKQAAGMARAIEKTTAEQARGVAQISEAAVSIAHQIEQIAAAMQEQRRGSERIVQAAEKMRTITRQVNAATQEQAQGSKQIAAAVESVTAQTAQVARSTSEQNQGARQINEAIERIQKITQENVDVSVELDIAIQALKEKAAALQAEMEKFKL
jgi:methyl-accepting chemotaxis protein